MNKLKVILAIFALLIGTVAIANVSPQTSLYDYNDLIQNTYDQMSTVNNITENRMNKIDLLGKRYLDNFRNCEPIYLNQYINWFGLKIGVNIEAKGWVDNKCEYDIKAKLDGLGKDIKEIYNIKISDKQLSQIEPQIKCGFTKEQLNALVDYITTEEKNVNNSKIKKENPEKLTPEDKEFLSHFMDGNICTVVNMETLKPQILELMQSAEF
jgi:hypothetical protein